MATKRSISSTGGARLTSSSKKTKQTSTTQNPAEAVTLDSDDTSKESCTTFTTTEVLFKIGPRENDFTERSWWLVDTDTEIGNDRTSQGATALVKRCMRIHNWDLQKARKVLKAYWQFLMLKNELRDWDATLLSPCLLVDQMWHQHILDVVNYNYDMMLLCGVIIQMALSIELRKQLEIRLPAMP